jgi:molybdopterin molybdotransferase
VKPPPLKDDCFSMPPGVEWTPVDDALDRLRAGLSRVVGSDTVNLSEAGGRVLAEDIHALRSNPPLANSAVDGYGFAFDALGDSSIVQLPLMAGRAAAGLAFDGMVPEGHAIRILTGAAVPSGVDTVVLEEDTTFDDDDAPKHIAFRSGLKRGANCRKAGEDFKTGEVILPKGRSLWGADLALLAASGHSEVPVFDRLRVGILSTGEEVVPAGSHVAPGQIYDANRPMLLDILRQWGFVPVDLGHVGDDVDQLRDRLDQAAVKVDAILTSGGASAGDEDHVSALLSAEGGLQTWRIAVKPGRPLALALWNGVPVFGLPGNPVAALVCTLIFARPALSLLSGAPWPDPLGFDLPAAFSKSKKPGRREFQRARVTAAGAVELFQSEGSGRISGLSWAGGLVELPDGAVEVAKGDRVRFIPYASFGLGI